MSAKQAAWPETQAKNVARENIRPSAHGQYHALLPPRLGGWREMPHPTHVSTAEKWASRLDIQDALVPMKKVKRRLQLSKSAWMDSRARDPRM